MPETPRHADSHLETAGRALECVDGLMKKAASWLSSATERGARLDEHQVVAYDLAHAASGAATERAALSYGTRGSVEAEIATVFVGEVLSDFSLRFAGREDLLGLDEDWQSELGTFLAISRAPDLVSSIAETPGPLHLDDDFELVRESFRRFADAEIAPVAQHVHRENADIPESVISGLAEMGGFGLSIPEEYGGFAAGGDSDYLGMVVATEELSRASLGAGGALVTRPEILARALLKGGTDEQRGQLLPRIASGEVMVAVAVTEPDFGSDVANLSFFAREEGEGYVLNGVKTWCTFAARAELVMLLARTEADRSLGHRGLSLFAVEKPRTDSGGFRITQPAERLPPGIAPGTLEGRPIDTLGYRGMHSYELSFDNYYVDASALIGGRDGRGRGFYLQMAGFENGRLQTAARAIGVMQAAYEAARVYATGRVVFGRPIADYELTRYKLGRMVAVIQASRQFAYEVARRMARGEGSTEASMVKAYVCRAAEWVTREAMQIHGGMGYAEEFPVSRYFVDARVLSIFEGADETLCLKVIARRLAESPDRAPGEQTA